MKKALNNGGDSLNTRNSSMDTVGEAGDVMHLSQNWVETFIDRI